jgi:PAS domain S-box-containing protein
MTMSLPRETTAELFRAIAEYTYDWETWVDAHGRTRWVNAAVTRITGYAVAECLELPSFPLPLAHEADRAILERVLADARVGGSGNDVEFRVRTRDGSERWVAISWQSVRSDQGVVLGYRTSIRDIDERKHMEDELRELRQRAEALAHARSELLANVSHELRAPAHCIAGFAELMLRGQLDDQQRRHASIILEQCRSMQRQVEDLLSLTALEAGGVELSQEPVDLPGLVQGLIEAGRPRAEERALSLEAELALAEPLVVADGLRLTQVLRNLIDNALKFTERGSITLRVAQESGQRPALRCEVIDTGRGMEPAQIENMLLPFRQGGNSQGARHGGVGLGLAIVQRMVQAMHGELHIDSQPGVGTRVRVRLPWVRAERAAPAPAPAPEQALPPGTALVVDDSAPARELLAGLLSSCGFASREAASAGAAEKLAAEQAFDVAFVDYQMPDCDGATAALRLRRLLAQQAGRSVPIYLLTANVFVHQQLGAARGAVDGVLAKPLSRTALLRVLAQLQVDAAQPALEREPAPITEEVVADLLATRARGGESLLHKLLPRVEHDVSETLGAAHQQLAQRDAAALRKSAHALAGHTGLVGARAASSAAQQLELTLEAATQSPPWEQAMRLLESCERRWALALVELQRRVAGG